MVKFGKQSLCQKKFICMTRLHVHYICIVCARHQLLKLWYKLTLSRMHYLSTSITLFIEKMAKFTKLSFCQTLQMFIVSILCKQSIRLYSKRRGTS